MSFPYYYATIDKSIDNKLVLKIIDNDTDRDTDKDNLLYCFVTETSIIPTFNSNIDDEYFGSDKCIESTDNIVMCLKIIPSYYTNIIKNELNIKKISLMDLYAEIYTEMCNGVHDITHKEILDVLHAIFEWRMIQGLLESNYSLTVKQNAVPKITSKEQYNDPHWNDAYRYKRMDTYITDDMMIEDMGNVDKVEISLSHLDINSSITFDGLWKLQNILESLSVRECTGFIVSKKESQRFTELNFPLLKKINIIRCPHFEISEEELKENFPKATICIKN
jgi:hypothetical protein